MLNETGGNNIMDHIAYEELKKNSITCLNRYHSHQVLTANKYRGIFTTTVGKCSYPDMKEFTVTRQRKTILTKKNSIMFRSKRRSFSTFSMCKRNLFSDGLNDKS